MERLKKVASSSSRVIANLHQAASGTFQTTANQINLNQSANQVASSQQPDTPAPAPASAPVFQQANDQQAQAATFQPASQLVQVASDPVKVADADAGAQTLASQASAHLTEEEQQILLQVFRRQEQFRLEHMKNKNDSQGQSASGGGGRVAAAQTSRLMMQQQQLDKQRTAAHYSVSQQARPASSLGASPSTSATSGSINNNTNNTQSSTFNYDLSLRHQQCPSSISSSSSTMNNNNSSTQQVRPSSVTSHLTRSNNNNNQQTSAAAATSSSSSLNQAHNNNNNNSGGSASAGSCMGSLMTIGQSPVPSSTPTAAVAQPPATPIAGSQCPICWKLILEREELTHLCSNCNKFICDDCASYSTNEQDWMCSSCRRRVTKQAVPEDSLRDLGIEPSDSMLNIGGGGPSSSASGLVSMQRRMTLRPSINQNQALGQSSQSSGLGQTNSSSSQAAQTQTTARSTPTPSQAPPTTSSSIKQQNPSIGSKVTDNPMQSPLDNKDSPKLLRKTLECGSLRRKSALPEVSREAGARGVAAKLTSKPMGGSMGGVGSSATVGPPTPTLNQSPLASQSAANVIQQQHQQQPPPVKPRQSAQAVVSPGRRASVATPESMGHRQMSRRTSTLTGPGSSRVMSTSQVARALTRKQSIVTFYSPGPMYSHGATNSQLQYQQQQQNQLAAMQGSDLHQQQQVNAMRRCSMASTGGGFIGQQMAQPPPPIRPMDQLQQQQMQMQQQHVIGQANILANQMMNQSNQSAVYQQHAAAAAAVAAAGGPTGSRAGSRATSRNSSQHSLNGSGSGSDLNNTNNHPDTLMIPIPPDQMHLRRLSDQSNLVRRSSIIADTLDVLAMSRHRSHSNIDSSVPFSTYLYQHSNDYGGQFGNQMPLVQTMHQGFVYSDENVNNTGQQQGFPTGFYGSMNAHQQQQQQQQAKAAILASDLSQQHQVGAMSQQQQQQFYGQQPPPQQPDLASSTTNQQMSSIITPYSQKLTGAYSATRATTATGNDDDMDNHSDSSSDIDDDDAANDLSKVMDGPEQLPGDYFAPPRALSNTDYFQSNQQQFNNNAFDQQQQQLNNQLVHPEQPLSRRSSSAAGQSMAIPSVSVSEFRNSNQQKLINNKLINQQQQQDQQQQQYQEQIMTTPMQINVAIEQAIEEQRRRQSLMMTNNESFLGGFRANDLRRGSSGRALPNIPGSTDQQSRSLLELSHHPSTTNTATMTNGNSPGIHQVNGGGPRVAGESRSNSIDHLGLPGMGHVRRASAPEGQNIKIVVDDIDHNGLQGAGAMFMKPGTHQAGGGGVGVVGAGGDLLERVVLYRDDTMDPSTNMTRGFGLRVMGGKIVPKVGPEGVEKLDSIVTWVLPGGPADKAGIKQGDHIIEWDGKCLLSMSYEQVAEVIESSANIAELLIRPANRLQPNGAGTNYVRSGRRMSQQTEKDLRRLGQTQANSAVQQPGNDPMYFDAINNVWRSSATGAQANMNGVQSQQHQSQFAADNSYLSNPALQMRRSSDRTGTGRQLPQIPGLQTSKQDLSGNLNPNDSMYLGHRHSMCSSTGELESRPDFVYLNQQNNAMSNQQGANNYLNANNPSSNYQSHSTGELDHQQQALMYYNGNQQQNGYDNSNYESTMQNQRILAGSPNKEEILALIGLQVNVDERQARLQISVLSAININLNMNHHYYVRIGILPESGDMKPCTTQVSGDLNWKETFIYENFPVHQMNRMAFEIALWPWLDNQLTTDQVQPVCGTMISVQSAREKNTDFWPLRALINSNQLRRKSLNDLIENQNRQYQVNYENQQLAQYHQVYYRGQSKPVYHNDKQSKLDQLYNDAGNNYHDGGMLMDHNQFNGGVINGQGQNVNCSNNLAGMNQQYPAIYTDQQQHQSPVINGSDDMAGMKDTRIRRRSSTHRNSFQNLPGSRQSQTMLAHQPRRASDEVASLSVNRLSANRLDSPSASGRRSKSVVNVNNQMNMISAQQIYQLQQQQQQQLVLDAVGGYRNPMGDAMNIVQQQGDNQNKTTPTRMEANQQRATNMSNNSAKQSPIDNQNRATSSSSYTTTSSSASSNFQNVPPPAAYSIRRRSSVIGQSQQKAMTMGADSEHQVKPQTPSCNEDNGDSPTKQTLISDKTKIALENRMSTPQAYLVATNAGEHSQQMIGGRKRAASSIQLVRKDSLAKMALKRLTRNMSFTKPGSESGVGSNELSDSKSNSQNQLGSNKTLNEVNSKCLGSCSRRKSSSSSAVSETQTKQEDKAVTRRILARDCQVGQLKVSLLVSKGHLELEIICAQDLRLVRDPSLGVYVKVYVKGARNRVKSHKKKTRVVYGRTDSFQFKHLIKYDASLVDNRILEISVWQKQGGLKGKIALGTTEIVLANLDLGQLQTSWYNLRPHDVVENSSVEE